MTDADPVAALLNALRDEWPSWTVWEAEMPTVEFAADILAALDAGGFAVVPKDGWRMVPDPYNPEATIARLRKIEEAARAFVDFWEGPPYVSDDGEISDQVDLLRAALEAGIGGRP